MLHGFESPGFWTIAYDGLLGGLSRSMREKKLTLLLLWIVVAYVLLTTPAKVYQHQPKTSAVYMLSIINLFPNSLCHFLGSIDRNQTLPFFLPCIDINTYELDADPLSLVNQHGSHLPFFLFRFPTSCIYCQVWRAFQIKIYN